MPATIIETNQTPLKTIEVEGVTVDIIENALKNARVEMDAVLFRTAMSPGIREQGDCFPMIANKDGKMVVGQFGSFIGPFMEAYNDDIEEGDIIIRFNGEKVESPEDLQELVAGMESGDEVKIKIVRDEREKTLSVTIGGLPEHTFSMGDFDWEDMAMIGGMAEEFAD